MPGYVFVRTSDRNARRRPIRPTGNPLGILVERLNKIDSRLSALEDAQKHVATKMWVVGTGLTTIVVLTGLIINLLNYLKT